MINKIEVINRLKPILDRLENKNRWLLHKKSLAMAQIIVESRWLKSAPGNNCLGIKVPKSKIGVWKNVQLKWTKEWDKKIGKLKRVQAWFMTYPSIEACIESGYIKTLSLDRYKETRDSIDWWDATNQIRIDGYATSPVYSDTLRNLILKEQIYKIDWIRPYNWQLELNFLWGETFSPVRFKGITYTRVIESPIEYWPNIIDLATELQIGRDFIGQPFVITPRGAWGRITEYNYQCGGAKESQHLIWNGVDIYNPKKSKIKRYTTYEFYKIMNEKTDCPRYGIGCNFLHIDRKKINGVLAPKTTWNY